MFILFPLLLYFFAYACIGLVASAAVAAFVPASVFSAGVAKSGRLVIVVRTVALICACLGWLGASAIFSFFGEDISVKLPNGYAIRQHTNDQNEVFDPKARTTGTEQERDIVSDISRLQLAGPWMLGVADSIGDSTAENTYFLLDTRTGRATTFRDERTLAGAARKAGVQLALEPTGDVLWRVDGRWRAAWIYGPPAAMALVWFVWILRRRRL